MKRHARAWWIGAACLPGIIAAVWVLFVWGGANDVVAAVTGVVMFFMVSRLVVGAWLERREQKRRERLGLCLGCGFDLRASRDRCPECGRSVPAAEVRYPGEAETVVDEMNRVL